MKTVNLLIILLALNMAGCFRMSDVEVAQESGEWGEFCKLNLASAERGDTVAQTNVGWCYQEGLGGFAKNIEAAIEWYTKAARKGDADAQSNLIALHVTLPAVDAAPLK